MARASHRMTRSVLYRFVPVLAFALLAGCESSSGPASGTPPAVVLFIGDGMGQGAVDAARLSGHALAMETLPIRGRMTTASASDSITDSAASATALASGVPTYNGAVGVDADTVAVETVLEAAEARGWATGLVATSSITHATPAAFAAHVPDRGAEAAIAVQMVASGVDVLVGGGRRYFDPEARPDGRDLAGDLRDRGCTVAYATPLPTPSSAPDACLVVLLARGALPPASDRSVSLADLTGLALDVLMRDPDGFFLMVEGSQIDWAGHANDGPGLVAEMADFDDAVGRALERLVGRENTVVIVTGDHETGGLTATREEGAVVFDWSTTGHTAAAVPVYGVGVGLDALSDTVRNDGLGALLLERVRR